MELLEEYGNLIANIKHLSDEIPELREQLKDYEHMLAKYKRNRADLDMESSRKQSALVTEELNRLTAAEYSRINSKQAEIDSKLQVYTSEHEEKLKAIAANNYDDKLHNKYVIASKLKAALKQYSMPKDIPPELIAIATNYLSQSKKKYTNKALLELIDNVHEAYDDIDLQPQESESFTKVIDFITLKSLNKSSMQNYTKFLVYIAYLVILVLLCVVVPGIPIVLIGVTAMLAYRQYSKSNKTLIEFILPYSSLEDGLRYVNNEISTKLNEYRTADTQLENDRFNSATVGLYDEKGKLEVEYSQAAEAVRMRVSPEELQQRVEAQFRDAIKKCEADIANTEKSINRTNKFIASNEQQIPKLKERQKEMLVRIKDAYLNPTKPGTSRRLIKSFFLGIDEKQGNLIEFKYDGNTTLIMYKGESCRTNKELISMMLMQLLSSMSMTSLSIYLTDLKSAGSDYAVFFQPELAGKLHMCATDAEVKNAITALHAELIMRTRDILTEAESLEQYNEVMLARKSLPREYIFLLLQDPSDKDMEKQELQQLLNNGPTVGIIPIIFLRHADIVSGFKTTGNTTTDLISFFKAFGQYSFTFDGVTNDLTATPDLSATIISMLKKGKSK